MVDVNKILATLERYYTIKGDVKIDEQTGEITITGGLTLKRRTLKLPNLKCSKELETKATHSVLSRTALINLEYSI